MKTNDFDYDLPQELIAQTPLLNRSASRLMVISRANQTIEDHHFNEIPDYFHAGDVLVRNNTRVIPARLFGIKEETNGHVEMLLLKDLGDDCWECLLGNARIVKLGTEISFGDGLLKARCLEIHDKGVRIMKMIYDGIFMEILDKLGETPLPPYIREKLNDPERYQTVYSKIEGSAAAPTAGLHFTEEIFQQLRDKGVTIVDITLHIGLGTFRPVQVDDIADHIMHTELYHISDEAAEILNLAKKEGRRITAIGTTSVRTLEANYGKYGCFKGEHSQTDIFIYPGYEFKAIDSMITNFHLPKSTLIMMICAFAGKEFVMKAYRHAIDEKYRFFSFGDSMLIL